MHELNKIDSTNKIRKKNIIQLVEIINNKEDLKALEFNFKDNNFLRLPVICSKEKRNGLIKFDHVAFGLLMKFINQLVL